MESKKIKATEYAKKVKDISNTLENLVWEIISELRESEQRFRSIVEFAADAIISISPDTKVTSWNKGATNIFGFTEEEALDHYIDDLIAKDNVVEEAQKLSQKVIEGQSIRSIEATRYTKSGSAKTVLISASPIKREEGSVEAVSLMYKDISELKRAHEQLVQTEKQATLGVIAGSIGHELNNLVGGLLVHAKLLQQYYDKPHKVKEVTEVFLTNLEKVALHGKNLLSLSTPTKPRFEPLDLNVVLKDTTDTLVLSGVLKHIEIQEKYGEFIHYINGDRHLLEQMIRNLEINSAHAMKKDGKLILSSRFDEEKKFFELEFKDNGTGIDKSIQEKIFEPFFTTKSEGQGTGLGLPIVKNIVEQHNGYIHLNSTKDEGTTIVVGIPVVEL